jgi:hypothetical protein
LSQSEQRESSKRNLLGDPSKSGSPVRKTMQGLHRSSANTDVENLRRAVGLEEDLSLTKSQREHGRRACHLIFCMLSIIGLMLGFGFAAWNGLLSR